ncbi:MAG: phospholipase D-like domain-containing protein, partial [Desulfobacterales bacterium]|nr:phospholipase D-like domain-containing protein [Desulfobacterales bacterium]
TNSLASTDVSIVHAGYVRYRERLLKGGVELYEVNKKADSSKKTTFKGSSKASLHAKSFIFDRKYIFIGSLNLDPRSFIQNTEIGVLFSSKDIGEQLGIEFKRISENAAFRLELVEKQNGTNQIIWHGKTQGKPVSYKVDPHTSVWKRFAIDFMRLLPIESQL